MFNKGGKALIHCKEGISRSSTMAIISYTKTNFREPARISENSYSQLRLKILRNPEMDIDPSPETFSQHFKGALMTILVSFFLFIFCFGVFKEGSPMIFIGGISMCAFLFFSFMLLIEGPSYATYIKQKKEYFLRMKYAIQNTTSYYEFVNTFYK